MTDHKFTDEEIEKAMKHCSLEVNGLCKECPLRDYSFCTEIICEYSLALINRQKVKIEGLESNLKFVRGTNRRLIENESIVRAEAIKEFAKKIKTDAERICDDNYIEGALIKYVDTLVKEMTETK